MRKAPPPDIICGGFPCQDISVAGKGAGIEGAKSSLWFEFARIVRELRPVLVFAENVPPIVGRGLDRVLKDLAEVGMDAVWDCVRASDVGAPHKRERFFLLAYADGERVREFAERHQREGRCEREAERGDAVAVHGGAQLADADGARREEENKRRPEQSVTSGRCDQWPEVDVADSDGGGCEWLGLAKPDGIKGACGSEPDGRRDNGVVHRFPPGPSEINKWDGPQPAVRRVDARVPSGMDRGWRAANRASDRLRLLGNACVPQQAARAFKALATRAGLEAFAEARRKGGGQ